MNRWKIQYRYVGDNKIRTLTILKTPDKGKRDVQFEFTNSYLCKKSIPIRGHEGSFGGYRIREFVNCKMI